MQMRTHREEKQLRPKRATVDLINALNFGTTTVQTRQLSNEIILATRKTIQASN